MAERQRFAGDVDEITESISRTLWVQAWADWAEENEDSFSGVDMFDVAPDTPESADKAGKAFVRKIEQLNGKKIDELYDEAANAEGKHYKEPTEEDFGYGIAMKSVGHGISWEDNHPDIGIKYPYIEATTFDGKTLDISGLSRVGKIMMKIAQEEIEKKEEVEKKKLSAEDVGNEYRDMMVQLLARNDGGKYIGYFLHKRGIGPDLIVFIIGTKKFIKWDYENDDILAIGVLHN